jgi:EAL domain-containing protein (putative c-di-GMP-specific phosphodiesterase class I)/GGDEF domain-containing protein
MLLLAFGAAAGARPISTLLLGPVAVIILAWLVWRAWGEARAMRLAADLAAAPAGASVESHLHAIAGRLAEQAHREVRTHPVTGVPTREPLVEAMAEAIASSEAPRLLAAIRFTDFDRLSAFDQEGANLALRLFAERLAAAKRPAHRLGQVDRDCFCIWFGGGDLEAARAELRALAYVAGQELEVAGQSLNPSLEVGAVSFPADGRDPARLLVHVTATLARPRFSSLGELLIPEPPPPDRAKEQFTLEQDLGQAIAEDQLAIMFQPVFSVSARRLVGAEALLRWRHPTLGPVPPAHFIPLAEMIGLSDRFGLWVLNAACREARRWRAAGLKDLRVAVNLSARQLLDPELETKVQRTLERNRLDACSLEFELTETAAMADAARTREIFSRLRELGVSLAIDDFGSGYSSLSYLKNLSFNKLKIDREFVMGVDRDADSRAICKALVELGRGLRLKVLAEGVETAAEVRALHDMGCDLFQGYWFSKPLDADDFLALARDQGSLVQKLAALQPSLPTVSDRSA